MKRLEGVLAQGAVGAPEEPEVDAAAVEAVALYHSMS